jgi:hypothetical protein
VSGQATRVWEALDRPVQVDALLPMERVERGHVTACALFSPLSLPEPPPPILDDICLLATMNGYSIYGGSSPLCVGSSLLSSRPRSSASASAPARVRCAPVRRLGRAHSTSSRDTHPDGR